MITPEHIAAIQEERRQQEAEEAKAAKISRDSLRRKANQRMLNSVNRHNNKHRRYEHRAERVRGSKLATLKRILWEYSAAWASGNLHQGKYLETSSALLAYNTEQDTKTARRHIKFFIEHGFIVRKYSHAEAWERFKILTNNQNFLLEINPTIVKPLLGIEEEVKQEENRKEQIIKTMQQLAAMGEEA